jgi:hypothetical protein
MVGKENIPTSPTLTRTLSGALAGVGCPACGAATTVIPIPIVAVSWLGPVFLALENVAGATQELRLQRLLDQLVPCPRHVRADRERFGLGINVIELELVGRATSNALPAE